MDALEAIFGRRSIRKYTDQAVSAETTETLLRAAMSAPSANNAQPWRFVVITERAVLDAIPTFHPYSEMLHQAPLAILVCADKTQTSQPGYELLDCSAATQNLLVAAHALGLGAVWLGIFPREERMRGIKNLVCLPDHILPVALVSVGQPAEHKPPADRFDAAKIHYNTW